MAASPTSTKKTDGTAGGRKARRAASERADTVIPIREEVRSLKKEKIVEAAANLFFERGYHGSSVESICSILGVTKPFLYYHFQKKDDILKEIYMSALEAALDTIAPLNRADTQTCAAKLERFVRGYVSLATSEMRVRIALISREQNLLPDDMMGDVRQIKSKIYRELVKLIDAGVKAGEFEVGDPGITAHSMFGLMNWSVTWFRPEGRLSREALADGHVDACLRLAGWKGHPATMQARSGSDAE